MKKELLQDWKEREEASMHLDAICKYIKGSQELIAQILPWEGDLLQCIWDQMQRDKESAMELCDKWAWEYPLIVYKA